MDIILIMILAGAICYTLYIIFKSLSPPKIPKEYLINNGFREVDDSFHNEMDQRWEDMKVERYIREEAYNKYRHHIANKDRGKGLLSTGLIYIGSPLGVYTIYDEKTAKYKDGNINKIINEEYNKLIEKYEL